MAAALVGKWKLVETEKVLDLIAGLKMSEEKAAKYKVMTLKGDDGLHMEISSKDKVITVAYSLKGEVKHTDNIKLGETTEITDISGTVRKVTGSIENGVFILKLEGPTVENHVEKVGEQIVMSVTGGGVTAKLTFDKA